jgi:hypothetical protein
MNFNYFHKQINKIIEENHKNPINIEINYNELKTISINIFNLYYNEFKIYEKNFNIYVIKKLYNESEFNLSLKLLFNLPDFYTIILNDFIKFIFEIIKKTKQNICSKIYNSCYKDGEKIERLPEYKYHYYLTNNKEKCIYNWLNEYKNILNSHLNNNLNNELYIRQSNIIIKLAEIKAELKKKKDLESSNDNQGNSIKDLESSNDNQGNSIKDLESSNDNKGNLIKDLESSNDNKGNLIKDLESSNDNQINLIKDLESSNNQINLIKDLESSNDNQGNLIKDLESSNDNQINLIKDLETIKEVE